ncbi:receptor-like protein kinase [Klebsormidium nitens]|uniref:non-specific serine/threonine protein kinase n=1 Tax=Klebsormidium nitens TaxID=105231 RepID=A0A1Y1I4W9_KLENI|nr:receptor-like protein kinase [Klebsormidium nitens]|eukprot:GAQ85002.1 receptor-like protein kinase [Klebsormidium nitens]
MALLCAAHARGALLGIIVLLLLRTLKADPGDGAALLEFKWGLKNPQVVASWSEAVGDPCVPGQAWLGVTCSGLRIVQLVLDSLDLSGPLTPGLGNLGALQRLQLANNSLASSIPSSFGQLTNLQTLDLRGNLLTGSIPAELGSLRALSYLDLSFNGFSGQFPSALGSLSTLTYFSVSGNLQLTGALPSTLGQLSRCTTLLLDNNQFQGPVPDSFGNLSALVTLTLEHNSLFNNLPSTFANLVNLETLTAGYNQLSGLLPAFLGTLPRLRTVRLNNNGYSGSIPAGLNRGGALQTLDISSNYLTQAVPASLLTIPFLNVSNNRGLCGAPGLPLCSDGSSPPSPETSPIGPPGMPPPPDGIGRGGGGGSDSGTTAGIVVGVLLAMVLVIAGGAFLVWRRRRGLNDVASPTSKGAAALLPLPSSRGPLLGSAARPLGVALPNKRWDVYSYRELSRATGQFSEDNILGEGGFGHVYKGVLKGGDVVAVKRLGSARSQGEREFRSEVDIISSVRHRNVVRLRGCCSEGAKRLLVYDYLPNGSLDSHLFGERAREQVMPWATRLRIAVDSARGLAYLHEDCSPRIIHRDVKSSNILLDERLQAKVADFGLARLSGLDETHVTTRVIGTFGYLAPEYAMSGQLTEKSDVYSFGVVLLELITGRKAVDTSRTPDAVNLVDWAKTLAQAGRIGDLGDPAESIPKDELLQVAEVAFTCVRRAAGQRPKMSQVMALLEQIEKKEYRIDMSNVSGSLDEEPPDYGMAPGPPDSYPSQTHLFAELVHGGDAVADAANKEGELGAPSDTGLNRANSKEALFANTYRSM